VVAAREAYDREACVGVVVLLEVGLAGRVEMQVGVLAEEVDVVVGGYGDGGVVEEVGQAGEGLGGLEGPGGAVPLALGQVGGGVVTVLLEVAWIGGFDGAEAVFAG